MVSWSRVGVGPLHVANQLLADRIEQPDPDAVVRGRLLHRDIGDSAFAAAAAEQRLLRLDAQQRKIVRQYRQRRYLELRVGEIRGEQRVELEALYGDTTPAPCEQLAFEVVAALRDRAVDEHRFESSDRCRKRVALESRVPYRHVVGDVLAHRRKCDTDHVAGARVAVDDGADRHRAGCANALYRVVHLMRVDNDLDLGRR